MPDYLTTCEQAARAAGRVLLDWRGRFAVREKGPADLVTEADVAAQNVIRQILESACPNVEFVGEESAIADLAQIAATDSQRAARPLRWFVDPLDGTTNYVHGLPGWCVSIALTQRDDVLAGCVYDPISEQMFLAERGSGAFCNGIRLQTSEVTQLRDALVAVSFPTTVNRDSPEIRCFLKLLPHIQAFRRLGSAALNLCHVAAGQMDAYWASSVNAWDVAAGVLFVREARGIVTGLRGEPYQLAERHLSAAANETLHEPLVRMLHAAWPTP